jgi:hypothetical protein
MMPTPNILLRDAHAIMMMMIRSLFGQLGLWAPFLGVRDEFTSIAFVFTQLFPVIQELGNPR